MALKQRKQITGTTEQINQYAGVEGQLVWDKSAKTLVGMSGTAGKNYPLAPKAYVDNEVSKVNSEATKKADKTYVDQQLAKKQPIGDYATNAQLTQGLAGKAPSVHTHTKSQITDFPAIPDTSTLIPKSGNRGSISGWEASGRYTTTTVTITKDSPDTLTKDSPDTLTENVWMLPATGVEFTVPDGDSATTFTKVVKVYNTDIFSLGGNWKWAGNKAPEMKQGFVVLHWNNDAGVANLIAME